MQTNAQTAGNIAGQYYLEGVREMASGFQINADSTFNFFFSYGALDRYGSGHYTRNENRVVLNSSTFHATDFKLQKSSTTKNGFVSIQINKAGNMPLQHVYCKITGGGKTEETMANSDGFANFTGRYADSITLIFEFCSEKQSVFVNTDRANNYFEFSFEPWVTEVAFKNFELDITGQGLSGRHPLLDQKTYTYRKE